MKYRRNSGNTPYFRLAWDVGAVSVCARHKTELLHICPDARHKSAYVVPGWCAHCGAFLGDDGEPPVPATPEELWKATQVGAMVKTQASLEAPPSRKAMLDAIQTLVTRLDNGKGAVFARRVGLSKTTVHCWLKEGGAPALPAHADGKAINLRELHARVPKEVLGSIRGVIDVLQEVKETLGASQATTGGVP